jgi:hypothetical protein
MSGEGTISFVEFADELEVRFEAGQRAFALVAFDGVQPKDLEGEDREWAYKVFGPIDTVPPDALDAIGIVAGGRSGKTYLCSLRLLHLALTVDLSILAPGEQAFAAIIAPRLQEARQGLRYAAGAARKHPDIKKLIVSDTDDQLVLERDDGERVAIMAIAAGAGGIGGRGKTLIGLLMDETCFFKDASSGVVNDQAVYDAAEPRVMDGGQTMVASTPWVARGLLHTMYKKNWQKPGDHLIAHASTRNMRTNERQLKKVDKAYRKDANNAAIEFGAEWGSTTTELFFTEAELDALFADDAPGLGRLPRPGDKASAGGDLGFIKNSSTLAIVHELPDGLVVLAHLEEQKPPEGQMLKPSVVCKGFAKTIQQHQALGITADQHEKASLSEHMSDAGLLVYPAPAAADALIALRAAVRENAVRAAIHERLRNQFESIKQRRTHGNHIQVIIPEAVDGSHCDVATAFAQAVWGLGRWGGAPVRAAAAKADPNDDAERLRAHKEALRKPPERGKFRLDRLAPRR